MKKVRNSLFETNSSSVHTITIDKRGMEKPSLDIRRRKKDDGTFGKFIIGKLGTFEKILEIIRHKMRSCHIC